MRQPMWPLLPMERRRSIERRARRRLQKLARLGHGAIGIVYLLIGVVAASAAWRSGRVAGTGTALRTILQGGVGAALLGLLGVGLAAHASWRFYAAAAAIDAETARERISHALMSLLYGTLAVEAMLLAGDSARGTAQWTAERMSPPFGPWLIGVLGIALVGFAAYRFRGVVSRSLELEIDMSSMEQRTRVVVERVGRIGISAGAVTIALVGVFLLVGGYRSDPGEASGLIGDLRALADRILGPWLLAAIAIGLAAHGAFQMLKAAYPPVTLRRAA